MKTNDIKEIWKSGRDKSSKAYSDSELNEMIVKSARKSIKAIHPGYILRIIIIAVMAYIIAMLLSGSRSKELVALDVAALAILSVSYFLWERSAYKMQKYTYGLPVKEWLEYRINEVEKKIKANTKYGFAIFVCSALFAVGFYMLYQILKKTPLNINTAIAISTGLVVFLYIFTYLLNQRYKKTLYKLKELYRQLELSNE